MAEFVARSSSDGAASLAVSGEVDIAVVDDLLSEARGCLSDAQALEVDLGGVTFMDSSGLGALVRLRNEATRTGKSVALTHVPASVHRLFVVTGLTEAFAVREDD